MSSETVEDAADTSTEVRARAPSPHDPRRKSAWNRFADAMRMYLTQGDAELARESLLDALKATKWQKQPATIEGPDGKPLRILDLVEVPDHPVRVAAAVRILEWAQGRPTERVEITHNESGQKLAITAGELAALMAERPSLASEILESIVTNAKPAQPAEDSAFPEQPAAKRLIGNQEVTGV